MTSEAAPEPVDILRSLIGFTVSLEELTIQVSGLEWDSDKAKVTLRAADVLAVLDRFLKDQLSADEIATWANLVESREDIDYEKAHAASLGEFIFEAANPELEGTAELAWATHWYLRLSF